MINVRQATQKDAYTFAHNLRAVDQLELKRSVGGKVSDVILHGIDNGDAWCAYEGDEPICIFGVVPTETPSTGVIWMLGTPLLDRKAKELVKRSRQWVSHFMDEYRVLFNFVDCDNTRTRRWLKALGFRERFIDTQYGVGRTPFVLVQLGE